MADCLVARLMATSDCELTTKGIGRSAWGAWWFDRASVPRRLTLSLTRL